MFGFSSPVFNDWISDPDFWRRSEPKVVKEALADLKRYHKYWGVHKAFKHESPSWKHFEGNLGNCGGFRTRRRAEFWPFSHLTNSQHLTAVEVRSLRQVILSTRAIAIFARIIWYEYSKVSSICWKHGHTFTVTGQLGSLFVSCRP